MRIFRAVTDVVLVELVMMFSKVTIPPKTGMIPVGSGAVRSLNHNIPSVTSCGLSLKLNANLLIREIHVIWNGTYRMPPRPKRG